MPRSHANPTITRKLRRSLALVEIGVNQHRKGFPILQEGPGRSNDFLNALADLQVKLAPKGFRLRINKTSGSAHWSEDRKKYPDLELELQTTGDYKRFGYPFRLGKIITSKFYHELHPENEWYLSKIDAGNFQETFKQIANKDLHPIDSKPLGNKLATLEMALETMKHLPARIDLNNNQTLLFDTKTIETVMHSYDVALMQAAKQKKITLTDPHLKIISDCLDREAKRIRLIRKLLPKK